MYNNSIMRLVLNINMADKTYGSVSKAIYNTFFWNYTECVRHTVQKRAELASKEAANTAFRYELEKEGFGGGFSPSNPYSEANLEFARTEVIEAEKEEKDLKVVMEFLRDKFLTEYAKSLGV